MKCPTEHSILLSPVGNIDAKLCADMAQGIERVMGFTVKIKPLIQDLAFAYHHERHQYHSTPILKKLADVMPGNATKLIGVTQVDLFIPILTYVFGEAQLNGKACIISTHRLSESLHPIDAVEHFHNRMTKEAIHELGHTFNLRHCKDKNCIMHYCRGIKDVDQKSDQFCRYCKVLIEDAIKQLRT